MFVYKEKACNERKTVLKCFGVKLDENIEDIDKKISMLEDIEDSMESGEESIEKSKYDELESKYNELNSKFTDLQTKYKERFFSGDSPEVKEVINVNGNFDYDDIF